MTHGKNKGFTLVELLIALAIIGILAGIAVPMFMGQRTKAMQKEAITNLESLRTLEEQFMAEKGEYAPDDVASGNGTLNGIANIQAKLPGFKPGSESNLKFNYFIDYTVLNATTIRFTARAVGKAGTPVESTNFSIDQDNIKGW